MDVCFYDDILSLCLTNALGVESSGEPFFWLPENNILMTKTLKLKLSLNYKQLSQITYDATLPHLEWVLQGQRYQLWSSVIHNVPFLWVSQQ